MMVIMILCVIVPGLLINRWITAKELERKRCGFEVKPMGDLPPVLQKKEDDHG